MQSFLVQDGLLCLWMFWTVQGHGSQQKWMTSKIASNQSDLRKNWNFSDLLWKQKNIAAKAQRQMRLNDILIVDIILCLDSRKIAFWRSNIWLLYAVFCACRRIGSKATKMKSNARTPWSLDTNSWPNAPNQNVMQFWEPPKPAQFWPENHSIFDFAFQMYEWVSFASFGMIFSWAEVS